MPDSHILVIETDPTMRLLCVKALMESGYTVYAATTAQAARTLLAQQRFDAVLCNTRLETDSGLRLLKEHYVQFIKQATQVIVLCDQPVTRAVCEELGFDFFPYSPFCPNRLINFLNWSLRETQDSIALAGD
jgi:DNA-binding response OmpR family regulator